MVNILETHLAYPDSTLSPKEQAFIEINDVDMKAMECALSWKNITYKVEEKGLNSKKNTTKTILKGITGRCASGEILAIMGPSGSGKTSLLDILADRVSSGKIEGDILINGETRDPKTYRAIANYVAQEDSLLGNFTVLETLRYAARLSLPSDIERVEREIRVQQVIDEMGLRNCENVYVGDIFKKGISGGQKRRLSIAIELLSNPSILLLDEPTSGLDAASTHNVMKYITSLANRGKSIVCTIHQPSADVYEMFHQILLLVEGNTVYYGTRIGVMDHFKSLGHACPQYVNPAEYYLKLINTDFDDHANVEELILAYKNSNEFIGLNRSIEEDEKLLPVDKTMIKDLRPSAMEQFLVILQRNNLNNIRNPGIYGLRILMYVCLCFLLGTLYLRTNKNLKALDYIPLLFFVQAFLSFMSVAVLPFFIEQITILHRERANNSLSILSYVIATFLAGLPGIFLISLTSSILVVYMADLNNFGLYLINLFVTLIVAESLMRVIGSMVRHYILGIALGAGILAMFMACAGFMVPKSGIPDYWIWIYYIAFHTYSFRTFLYNEFHDENTDISRQILEQYNMTDVNTTQNILILICYALILELIFGCIVYKFHTGRR